MGDKFADIEEKYDLADAADGFGEEGEEAEDAGDKEDVGGEEDANHDF